MQVIIVVLHDAVAVAVVVVGRAVPCVVLAERHSCHRVLRICLSEVHVALHQFVCSV